MEYYISQIDMLVLKMMVKSGIQKNFEIPPCAKPFLENILYFIEKRIVHKIGSSVIKMNFFAHGWIKDFNKKIEFINEV